ncbi:hypothetical protein P154DRAFT_527922 [Amniculicola lignicola CBS 123094]|uniref:Uncharacterized protein n=1 Tax=Amniculicola lignicola CBS 123094 TaxID=1392246 RepID=A0A6A5VX17_9PLEO|nr:hypothetical protein P154DRAFT_527922 [Amniculicola lignicola CBS 123094]
MASSQLSSTESTRNSILENGFFFDHDAILGQLIEEMDKDSIPFASAGGLQFCKLNVLDNPRIRPVLESFFEWFALGLYRSIGASPGDYNFRRSDPEAKVEVLLVQLWSNGSRASFWGGSHRHQLPCVKGENNLWRVPRVSLKHLGLTPSEVTFEQGGFTILDPRIAVEVTQGTATTFAFGTKEVVSTWNPMRLPKLQDVEETVGRMESINFGMNVAYVGRKET